MTDPLVTVFRDKFAKGWPEHEHGERGTVMPLSSALRREYATDGHFVAYASPNARRLRTAALERFDGIQMNSIVFDMDGPDHKPTEAWRRELREKAIGLASVHPAPFFYETRGGARLVFAQATPTILRSREDAKLWSTEYVLTCCYLERRFGIIADESCKDWQRHYRAPHATRDRGGKPENYPEWGDPREIGAFYFQPSDEDKELARSRLAKMKKKPRNNAPSSAPYYIGNGLFYELLHARGHILREAPNGGWVCICPNRQQHSNDTDGSTTTVVYPPNNGKPLGLIFCRHGNHCEYKLTTAEWLQLFSKAEIANAEVRAGIRKGSA